VAVSPDVGSFIYRLYGCGDLLDRSLIRNVAPSASPVILTTGTVTTRPEDGKSWPSVAPTPVGASHFDPRRRSRMGAHQRKPADRPENCPRTRERPRRRRSPKS
jgi:hypothetical protein